MRDGKKPLVQEQPKGCFALHVHVLHSQMLTAGAPFRQLKNIAHRDSLDFHKEEKDRRYLAHLAPDLLGV